VGGPSSLVLDVLFPFPLPLPEFAVLFGSLGLALARRNEGF